MRTVIWLTGLPGSGKTTIATLIQVRRPEIQLIDGEEIRKGLWPELGFNENDRIENAMRIGSLASMLASQGSNVVVATVSAERTGRESARKMITGFGCKFHEIRLHCEEARKPVWDHPYEGGTATLTIDTGAMTAVECATQIVDTYLRQPKRALFVGRYQPFHHGHEEIIREALDSGPVAIGVRVTEISTDNPYSAHQRISQITSHFIGEDVVVFAVPDIASIHVGRDVGYIIHQEVEGVSGKSLRQEAMGPDKPS